MTSKNRVRAALVTAVVISGLTGCGDAPDDAGAPGSVAGEGPTRPAAGGDDLVVEALPLEAPVVLDPVPEGVLVTDVSYNRPSGGSGNGSCATLYGDPALADTLDGPVLVLGTSSGSAHGGPPGGQTAGREVDLGGRSGRLVPDTDRTWVAVYGNEYVEFVVGRGIDEDQLIAAAREADFDSGTPTLATDAVPLGLEALVAGCPGDGPGYTGIGAAIGLQGAALTFGSVFAVRADPRLAALWGFWLEDGTGTPVRGRPGSAGLLAGTGGPSGSARARVWAEDGMVLAVVVHGSTDEVLDQVVGNLRVGTEAEVEALDEGIRTRPPTPAEVPCGPGGGFVSGVTGEVRWAFSVRPNPLSTTHTEWSACYYDLSGGGGGGAIIPPPPGELVSAWGGSSAHPQGSPGGIVGGVAPPGTTRVTITTFDGRTLEAQLAAEGPRPGERVWGAFVPRVPPPPGVPPLLTATAYDAAGTVLDSTPV